jgi:hypothetical protein
MKCTIVGSRYFGASVLEAFRADGIEIVGVIAPSADDRLAVAGRAAGLPTVIHENPRFVEGSAIPEDTGLIVAAHTHARVSDEALARSRLHWTHTVAHAEQLRSRVTPHGLPPAIGRVRRTDSRAAHVSLEITYFTSHPWPGHRRHGIKMRHSGTLVSSTTKSASGYHCSLRPLPMVVSALSPARI